jgi:hypothetical protein
MVELNAAVQDAKTLLAAAQKHCGGSGADGIDGALTGTLAIALVTAGDNAQRNAIRTVSRLTAEQDSMMDMALAFFRKAQNAAKGCYGEDDKQMMKEFRVGKLAAQTVKAMSADLAYMKAAVAAHKAELAKYGLKDSDLTALGNVAADLEKKDAEQELAKKAQKNATRALKQTMQKIRNTAKSVFAGNKQVLTEFEPIAKGRSGSRSKTDTDSAKT